MIPLRRRDYPPPGAHRASLRPVTLIYSGVALLVLAQVLGVYALVTHKADLVFGALIIAMVLAAVVLAGYGAYSQLG